MATLAAEHFCPEWPKALFTRSFTAWSGSAVAVMTMASFPLVSASTRRSGRRPRSIFPVR